jgi:hypothetical protein
MNRTLNQLLERGEADAPAIVVPGGPVPSLRVLYPLTKLAEEVRQRPD